MGEESTSHHEKKTPTFGIILVVLGILWFGSDMGYIPKNIPWFPIVMIIIGISWIMDSIKQ